MKKSLVVVVVCVLGVALLFGLLRSGKRVEETEPVLPKIPASKVVAVAEEMLPDSSEPVQEATHQAETAEVQSSVPLSERGSYKQEYPPLGENRNRRNWFADGNTLDSRDSEPDSEGRFVRTRLLETDFKYPLIQMEENLKKNAATGQEEILTRAAMVADHVMVRVQPGIGEDELSELVRQCGYAIRKKNVYTGYVSD